jgi:hypothetical protein
MELRGDVHGVVASVRIPLIFIQTSFPVLTCLHLTRFSYQFSGGKDGVDSTDMSGT